MITIRFFTKLRQHFDINQSTIKIDFFSNCTIFNILKLLDKKLHREISSHLIQEKDKKITDGIILFVNGKKQIKTDIKLTDKDILEFYTPPLGG